MQEGCEQGCDPTQWRMNAEEQEWKMGDHGRVQVRDNGALGQGRSSGG